MPLKIAKQERRLKRQSNITSKNIIILPKNFLGEFHVNLSDDKK